MERPRVRERGKTNYKGRDVKGEREVEETDEKRTKRKEKRARRRHRGTDKSKREKRGMGTKKETLVEWSLGETERTYFTLVAKKGFLLFVIIAIHKCTNAQYKKKEIKYNVLTH